jgi:hypothetical protein
VNWDLSRTGPVILLEAYGGELVCTMQVCWTQADQSSCALTRWQIDSQVTCSRLTGTNKSWDEYWQAFLDLLPDSLAAEVHRSELTVKY